MIRDLWPDAWRLRGDIATGWFVYCGFGTGTQFAQICDSLKREACEFSTLAHGRTAYLND